MGQIHSRFTSCDSMIKPTISQCFFVPLSSHSKIQITMERRAQSLKCCKHPSQSGRILKDNVTSVFHFGSKSACLIGIPQFDLACERALSNALLLIGDAPALDSAAKHR